ncbi:hypothetical protein [Myroides odoratimimus]|uniref:hypothetical protein n=1 Tax=Myroides odoratimimus TaxID=76832 RepID=UPI0013B42B54|nr:hypothetical protein [Myroides odoratimimus]
MSYTILRNSLVGVLATTYNMQEEELSKILPVEESAFVADTFKNVVLEKDAAKVSHGKEKFEQGYSKAKSEVLNGLETELKSKHKVEEDLKGVELINHIIHKVSSAEPKIENVSTHPEVLKLLAEKETSFKKQIEEVKLEYSQKEQQYQKERTFENVSKKALNVLDSLKPVLSTDSNKATNQKNILLNQLKEYDFQDNNGELIVLKDGKRHENQHGHGISFEELVKEKASMFFDFQQAEPRKTPDGGDPGASGVKLPKNDDEYAALMTDRNISFEDRMKIKEQYEAQKGNS